ncbi:hypothetical protein RRG08_056707 [Elysia crispata]|uniref:Uncharacterized protein n=1 Tax=Elysia crispata TaxID=231223 RepID=A0AAE1AWM0_9GAST|nr:hypothetical protein RRG08_056707 [Elysia crispata]
MNGIVETVLIAISVLIAMTKAQTITSCNYDESSCGCQTDKGLINLRLFSDDGLSTEVTSGGGTFYWNPCRDFTKDELTAACVQDISPEVHYDCGIHGNVASTVQDGKAVFTMKSSDLLRESRVTCVCGSSELLVFVKEEPTLIYNLNLNSKHCCPGFTRSRSRTVYSPGSILLIVFSSVVWVYFLGGMIVQSYVKRARGRERIPHVHFWSSLPGLIADGFRFTFTCETVLQSAKSIRLDGKEYSHQDTKATLRPVYS